MPMQSVAKRTIRARKMPHFPAVVNGFFLFLIITLVHAKSWNLYVLFLHKDELYMRIVLMMCQRTTLQVLLSAGFALQSPDRHHRRAEVLCT
jgi:hypothetical protein